MYARVRSVLLSVAIILPGYACVLDAGTALTQEEAVRLALTRNPEVVAARQEWEAARARLTQARALPDPEVGLEYDEIPERISLRRFGQRNVGAVQRVGLPVEWWLRVRAAGQMARAVELSVYETTKLDVVTRVKTGFARVLADREILTHAVENVGLTRAFLAKARFRFEAGDVARLEVIRAEVEVGRAEGEQRTARSALSVSEAALNALLAWGVGPPSVVAVEAAYEPTAYDLEELKALALARRPDLHGAGARAQGARLTRSAAVASLVPDLNVGLFRQSLRSPTGHEKTWRVSFGLEVPLWGIYRQRGGIAEAAAQAAQAAAQADVVHYQVGLDVERAYLELEAAEDRLQLFTDRILGGADQAYMFADQSYREGKATYLELMDAQRELTRVRVDRAEALYNCRAARAALERAVGGDLEQ